MFRTGIVGDVDVVEVFTTARAVNGGRFVVEGMTELDLLVEEVVEEETKTLEHSVLSGF